MTLRLIRALTTKGKPGRNSFVVHPTRRFHLTPGKYRIVVYAIDGTLRSSARTLALTVRP